MLSRLVQHPLGGRHLLDAAGLRPLPRLPELCRRAAGGHRRADRGRYRLEQNALPMRRLAATAAVPRPPETIPLFFPGIPDGTGGDAKWLCEVGCRREGPLAHQLGQILARAAPGAGGGRVFLQPRAGLSDGSGPPRLRQVALTSRLR